MEFRSRRHWGNGKSCGHRLLEQIVAEATREVLRTRGADGHGQLVQRIVGEVQARTGTTVPVSMAEAWLDACGPDVVPDLDEHEAVDPWEEVDARIDAQRLRRM